MADPRLLEINRATLASLHKAWEEKTLSVVVGAGASAQAGLPVWSQLLEHLLVNYVQHRFSGSDDPRRFFAKSIVRGLSERLGSESALVFAQYLQSTTEKPEDFLKLIRDALYGDLPGMPTPGPIHQAVARLGANLRCVLTFNFDELAEQALSAEGHENTSIWTADHWMESHGIPVYHPHGFIPYTLQPNQPYWTVLAESDYHTQYNSPFHWSNVAISKTLLESTCLFVSLSMSDPNLRRLLDALHRVSPNRQHFVVWGRPLPERLNEQDAFIYDVYEQVFNEAYKKIGVTPLWYFVRQGDEQYSDIPTLLDAIRVRART